MAPEEFTAPPGTSPSMLLTTFAIRKRHHFVLLPFHHSEPESCAFRQLGSSKPSLSLGGSVDLPWNPSMPWVPWPVPSPQHRKIKADARDCHACSPFPNFWRRPRVSCSGSPFRTGPATRSERFGEAPISRHQRVLK